MRTDALAAMLAVFILSNAAQAQEQPAPAAAQPLRVGVYVSPPFVMQENGRFTGLAVELWEALAAKLGLRSQYQVLPTLADLTRAASAGTVDVAVTSLSITRDRAERMDFTQPWFDSGLRIMVEENGGAGASSFIGELGDAGHLRVYGGIGLLILAATIALTLFDRHFNEEFPRRWPEGIAESFYTVVAAISGGQNPDRKRVFGWIGRIWQAVWLISGVALIAYVTASAASVMTKLSLTNDINSLADLSDKTVGVFTGSVAEEFSRNAGLASRSFQNIDQAVEALLAGRVDAIIEDAPVLEYYAHMHSDAPVTVVGAIFEPEKYGFALPSRSDLLQPLDVEVIGANESDFVAELRAKYFGSDP